MFDIGALELVIIGVVALLVVGPERLPRLARTAGRWVGRARRALTSVKEEIDREIKADELKEILRKQSQTRPLDTILEESTGLSTQKRASQVAASRSGAGASETNRSESSHSGSSQPSVSGHDASAEPNTARGSTASGSGHGAADRAGTVEQGGDERGAGGGRSG